MLDNIKIAVVQLAVISSIVNHVSSDILVYNRETHNIEMEFKDVPSRFGDAIPLDGIRGLVIYSNPPEACTSIEKPPAYENFTGRWIVLIKRYGCQFEDKIRNAQKAGYQAAIVHNVNSSALEPMATNNPYGIHIPSVFIGSESGLLIKEHYLYDDGYYVLINDDLPFNFTPHLLLIFSVLVGLCFFVMIMFIIVKYFKERRRQRRHRLPKSSLKKIPIHKFKNDPYEMCAICLEEYVENDKLRVLPCSHAYHAKCIDPWLTKNRRVCPVCKRKVFASGEVLTDTDSDTDDETAPLVRNSTNNNNAGTFRRQMENPFRRAMNRQTVTQPPASPSSSSSESTPTNNNVHESNSIQSMPEMPHQTASDEEIRNLIEEPSINSSGPVEITPSTIRTSGQNAVPRNFFSC